MLKSRPRRAATATATVAVLGLILAITTGGRGSSTPRDPFIASGSQMNGSVLAGWFKPHPRIVIAEPPGVPTPGDDDDGADFPSGNPDPPESEFTPPSTAEVKQELHQLNLAGIGGSLNGSGSYVNPFSHVHDLVPERIDMGVDYSGTGPVLALGSGTVFNTNGGGWPGGVFIGITLDSGPYAGKDYYIAEDITPSVKVGQRVQAGQVIGAMYDGGSGIETGWASGTADEALAAALHQQDPFGDPGGWSSASGVSFDRLLVSTGTPSGIPQGPQSHGTMPAGYP